MTSAYQLIGRGLYTVPEASRLTGVSISRIRRWTGGYSYTRADERHYSPPIIATQIARVEGAVALDFVDLMEIRFLDAFRKHGVSWVSIRLASERAAELIGHRRPFSTRRFKTDGRTILAELARPIGDSLLLDLVKNQFAFGEVISKFLYAGIEFNDQDQAALWRPLGVDREVLIDPRRAFGAPIVRKEGVPTRVLYNAYRAERSVDVVSAWYEVSRESTQDAVEYEEQLAA